jgi:hypothetical protein
VERFLWTALLRITILFAVWFSLSMPCHAQSASNSEVIPLQPYLRFQSAVLVNVNGQTGRFLFDTGEGVTSFSSVNAAVQTPNGIAWMELDNGNGGSMVIANHIAPLIGLKVDLSTPETVHFSLTNGIAVDGPARSRDLIMDGNIGAQFMNNWILTIDLPNARAWLSPLPASNTAAPRNP